jgi:catechol 2,3-dioxygenase-like lactoylglutathione lyase family enzyme
MGIQVNSLHHVAIRVRDQDASRRFYEDVLGFSFMEIPVSGDTVAQWIGAPSDGVMLAMQAGSTFVILSPPLEGTPADDRFSERRIGVDHLAFGVDGRAQLEELAASLEAAEVESAGIEVDAVLGKEYVCFRDPDNVQWEFYVST